MVRRRRRRSALARALRSRVPKLRALRVPRPLQLLAVVTLCVLASVNGAVRCFGGGDPHWLSPLHLREKVSALATLGAHLVAHGAACEPAAAELLIAEAARRHGISSDFALAVARTESALDAHAISRTGAMGVMQLMPGTAEWLGVADAFDPVQNTDGGARYLAQLLRRYAGDRVRALAAYNMGPGRVPRRGVLSLPAETRAYVRRILGVEVAAASM